VKKLSMVLLLLLMATMVAGCGKNPQRNEMIKQQSVRQEDNPAENLILIKKVEHDILGYGKMQIIALSVYQDIYGAPLFWIITADGQTVLGLDREDYDMADFKFEDIDGDDRDEILINRGSGGSAGALGLSVYKPGIGKWNELFAAKNSFDLPSKRFKIKYTGNYRVSFEDPETGLKAAILLEKERYKGTEDLLPKIISWVDPIADYEIKDTDGDGVMEITTVQRVIGISHPDIIALFKTMYILHDEKYRADKVSLYDDQGHLLAQVKLSN